METEIRTEKRQEIANFRNSLNNLLEFVESGRRNLLTKQVSVDKDELRLRVEAVRGATPETITRAESVLLAEQQIRQDAENKRNNLMSEANAYALTTRQAADEKQRQRMAELEATVQQKLNEADATAQQKVQDAERQAAEILEKARQDAEQMVEESTVMMEARKRYDEMMDQAQTTIDNAYQAMYDHFGNLFRAAESSVAQSLEEIRRTRNEVLGQLSEENPQQ